MKIKLAFITLLFSFTIFGQTNVELNQKLDKINSQVKFVDSIATYNEEEVSFGVIRMSHGRIDRKPIRELFTNTRITKSSNQIIRICYRERHPDYDEELNLYFFDNKFIYAERKKWKGKRNKFSMEKFYYENENEIFNLNSKKYPTEGIDVLIRAESLMKQASR